MKLVYIPNRIIDSDGISDGASIYAYQTGTTTKISLYADPGCTVPVANPYVVALGAAVPPLYYTYGGDVRLYVVSLSGEIQDTDPYYPLLTSSDIPFITPERFGAVGDGLTDDTAAIQDAIDLITESGGGTLHLTAGKTYRTNGPHALPSKTTILGPGSINFNAGASSYLFSLGENGGSANVSDITIDRVSFTSTNDVSFLHLVRVSNVSGTIDNFRFINNRISYAPATGPGAGDRWAIAGTGIGTRTNFEISGNFVSGPMQLLATPAGTGTAQHWNIHHNKIYNARSNAISLLTGGTVGSPCTLEDFQVTDNEIWADQYTSVGVSIGLDSSGSDRNVNLRRITVARNKINIASSASKTADIYIRVGNSCAGIGGFDSVASNIVIDDNELNYGFYIDQPSIVAASGLSKITGFKFTGNKLLGGDCGFSHLGDQAQLVGNVSTVGANIRPGINNGIILSQANTYSLFAPLTADAVFTWRSIGDTFIGSLAGVDRVITLNANAGKVQTAFFDRCTIDTYTSGTKQSAIYTVGAGNPTVTVRQMTTSTTWTVGRYEVSTGSLTETNAFVGSLGYTTGAGGTVTQITSKATGVTLNKLSGQITMQGAALAASAKASFVVTNSTVAATDSVIVSVASGGTANAYRASVTAVAAGSFTVTVENITAGSLSEAPVINFAVIKGVTA